MSGYCGRLGIHLLNKTLEKKFITNNPRIEGIQEKYKEGRKAGIIQHK